MRGYGWGEGSPLVEPAQVMAPKSCLGGPGGGACVFPDLPLHWVTSGLLGLTLLPTPTRLMGRSPLPEAHHLACGHDGFSKGPNTQLVSLSSFIRTDDKHAF